MQSECDTNYGEVFSALSLSLKLVTFRVVTYLAGPAVLGEPGQNTKHSSDVV